MRLCIGGGLPQRNLSNSLQVLNMWLIEVKEIEANLGPGLIFYLMRYHHFLLLLGTGGKTCLAGLYIVPYLCIHSRPVQTDSGPPKAPLYNDLGRVYSLNHVFPQLEGKNNSFSSVNNAVLYSKLITKVEEWSKRLLTSSFFSGHPLQFILSSSTRTGSFWSV